jgi:hypothetical protein
MNDVAGVALDFRSILGIQQASIAGAALVSEEYDLTSSGGGSSRSSIHSFFG